MEENPSLTEVIIAIFLAISAIVFWLYYSESFVEKCQQNGGKIITSIEGDMWCEEGENNGNL